MNSKDELHYHIHWSGKDELDWETHDSRAEADETAQQLVRPGETYTIEEHGFECPRCLAAMNLKMDHEAPAEPILTFKYPWQQHVSDAFKEGRAEFVGWKVNLAQRAISARLCDNTPIDVGERIAIREALQALRALSPENSNRNEPGQKKATA